MLSQGRVSVNGKTCMIAAFGISRGDTIEIGARRATAQAAGGLRVLYEDGDLLIVQKPPGLLTVATPDERDRTAYAYLREYLREHNPRQKLYIVHRLDKFASGVLVFAKSERVKSLLQGVFSRHDIERKYWAIVEGNVRKGPGDDPKPSGGRPFYANALDGGCAERETGDHSLSRSAPPSQPHGA